MNRVRNVVDNIRVRLQSSKTTLGEEIVTNQYDHVGAVENVSQITVDHQKDTLKQIVLAAMPNCDVDKWLDSVRYACDKWEITGERLCMFLAQIGHEAKIGRAHVFVCSLHK